MEHSECKPLAHRLLKEFYGYNSFRPGQYEIIEAVCTGRDAVVIMPTGGGKSLCYQIPALMLDGCAVVISPLIALMDDQVTALVTNGVPAAAIHSGCLESDNRRAADAALAGKLKILYMSPERLLGDLDTWLGKLHISLFAIDEAHCISQWGHDFRPVYTHLAVIKQRFPDMPVMALTATADRATRNDIARQLGLADPLRWLGSFNRPNLSLSVVQSATPRQRLAAIARLIKEHPNDSGIVYTLSRSGAEDVNKSLLQMGFRSCVYHAGMRTADRTAAQQAFTNGDVQVVCATIAFGMGIDKSNIRWVVHFNLPGSIENYYQEIGRAGRDGLPARTVLFYSLQDLILRRRFASDSGQPQLALEKLTRMQNYAEATVCRRRVLLSYFGEAMEHDCGNCDVCLDPPERFDGTVLVQMAGSAVIRTDSRVGQMMLIDILRGSARPELVRLGFDRIKTYGVGRDISAAQWRFYILQMVQLGLLEASLEDHGNLRVTDYGMRVVRGEVRVSLAVYRAAEVVAKKKSSARKPVAKSITTQLYEYLKTVRRQVADTAGVPAYMVLGDKSLLDMAENRPSTMDEFLDIHGVGRVKANVYGPVFLKAIKTFLNG